MIKKLAFLLFIIMLLGIGNSSAQRYFGVNTGYCMSGVATSSDVQDFYSRCNPGPGIHVGLAYEGCRNYVGTRLALSFDYLSMRLISGNDVVSPTFNRNMKYTVKSFCLEAELIGKVYTSESFTCHVITGLALTPILSTKVKGTGWDEAFEWAVDPNGDQYLYSYINKWNRSENDVHDFNNVTLSLVAGVDFFLPVNDYIDFSVGNHYFFGLNNFISSSRLNKSSLISGQLNVGIRIMVSY